MHDHRWRLGATSYVYAGNLAHNLQRLSAHCPDVADVELILFEGEGYGNLPAPDEVRELRAILHDTGLSVTVHLPADVGGTRPIGQQDAAMALNLRVIEAVASLNPQAWVFHIESAGAGEHAWYEAGNVALSRLIAAVDYPWRLALENLESYSPHLLTPFFAHLPISRTLDIGHLWKQGQTHAQVLAILNEWLPTTRVIHLHGVAESDGIMRDHLSLDAFAPQRIAELGGLLDMLEQWQGVLTLEVFEQDFFTSYDTLNQLLQRLMTHVA